MMKVPYYLVLVGAITVVSVQCALTPNLPPISGPIPSSSSSFDKKSNANYLPNKSPPPPLASETAITHRTCSSCNQSLERHLFPKKQFQKTTNDSTIICHACKKKAYALKIGQPPPKTKLHGRVAESGLSRRPNNFGYCNYIDQLFAMRCYTDIVQLGAFTSAKDVSESMAALQGALRHGRNREGDPIDKEKVLCLCIGDGSTPRSAVLSAFLKGWNCISIDPALSTAWTGRHNTVRGLIGFPGTLDEFMLTHTNNDDDDDVTGEYDHLVMLCVHSHARFVGRSTVSKIRKRYGNVCTTLVSLPCCAKFRHVRDIGRPPDVRYEDDCVFSACRTVEIWNYGHTGDDGVNDEI